MSVAIQFDKVGKLYQLGVVGTGTLSHDLNRWWATKILRKEDPYLKIGETNDRSKKGSSDFVWALRDITFDVEQGDVVGIIGKNGAGKSTLLKLLSRITSPSTGVIRARGRIGSLLEVGTGFHPEMTGRENIYMNGSIMGMTRAEITRKLDEIVDFAGVERYLDTPVKRYSSGMTVRLGFAVAAFMEPEILVVDEVLAVGDAEFQKKAIGKMKDVSQGGGRTVLFVSHNMASVRNLCNKGVLLENGQVSYIGMIEDVIDRYISTTPNIINKRIKDSIDFIEQGIKIEVIKVNNSENNSTIIVSNQEYLDIYISGFSDKQLICELKMFVKTIEGMVVASLIEGRYRDKTIIIEPGFFEIKKRIKIPRFVSEGNYYMDLYMHRPLVKDYFRAQNCVMIHFDGNFEGMGRPLVGSKDGFLGLETES